jgi:hypothetical protein
LEFSQLQAYAALRLSISASAHASNCFVAGLRCSFESGCGGRVVVAVPCAHGVGFT